MQRRAPTPIKPHPDVVIETQERVWDGRFPLDVVRFRNRRFDGAMSNPHTWEVWRRGRAVAMLPYDPQEDAVVLIDQFRFPALVAGIEPVLTEVPAGLLEDGEDPDLAMQRELAEETGLCADLMERIGDFILSPGGCDETVLVYIGRVKVPPVGPDGLAGHYGLGTENEDIRVRVMSAEAAIAAALSGAVTNVVTALALLWLSAERQRLRRAWRQE